MGGPNFWSYTQPADYKSPSDYKSPLSYNAPFQYSPPSTEEGGGGGGGGGAGKGFGGGWGGDGGESGDSFPRKIGWIAAFVYAALGMVGYVAAGSTMSLIGGAALSLPFAVASALMELNLALGTWFGLIFAALVFAYCFNKFQKSKKVVPGGALFAFSAFTLGSYAKALLSGL